MREFEKYEMVKQKCHICGCKNKVHTELINRQGQFAGYSLKCCNCGRTDVFYLDHQTNGLPDNFHPYVNGKQRCIQPSYCPKKDCPLYGKSSMDMGDIDFKDPPVPQDENYESDVTVELLHKPRFL